ncbi:hypothetical protein C8R47DRAFT_1126875 [Mycena vitilis]|nr:hypothetical protein C8R47DRAFT_1126875 [Mycena vitilis]
MEGSHPTLPLIFIVSQVRRTFLKLVLRALWFRGFYFRLSKRGPGQLAQPLKTFSEYLNTSVRPYRLCCSDNLPPTVTLYGCSAVKQSCYPIHGLLLWTHIGLNACPFWYLVFSSSQHLRVRCKFIAYCLQRFVERYFRGTQFPRVSIRRFSDSPLVQLLCCGARGLTLSIGKARGRSKGHRHSYTAGQFARGLAHWAHYFCGVRHSRSHLQTDLIFSSGFLG